MGRARHGCADGARDTEHRMVLYQSAAWTRKSNRLMNEFNSLERRAGLQTMHGMQQATIHTAMFMQLLAAQQAGNEKLVQFYVERFPPDVRKAYDAWLAQKPFENPKADPHPFVSNLYEVRGTREAAEANAKAASSLHAARNAGNVSGRTSRTLFCLPRCFSSLVHRESSSSAGCVSLHSFLLWLCSRSRLFGR